MKKTLTIGLSVIALAVSGAAIAQTVPTAAPAKAPVAEQTRAQVKTNAEARFAKSDVNKDGVLNQADREARFQARRTAQFDALDTNKNGQISREEFMTVKRDGKRTEAGKEGRMGKKHERGEMRGDKRGHWGKHHRGERAGGPDAPKATSITKADFVANALSRFDKLDANKDGKVTAEERKASRDAMRAQWQAQKAQKAN